MTDELESLKLQQNKGKTGKIRSILHAWALKRAQCRRKGESCTKRKRRKRQLRWWKLFRAGQYLDTPPSAPLRVLALWRH